MKKDSKTSTARETVYDRCAYVGCYNGKFINGRRLFHFPAETDRRLEMWIERSGNFRLRTWAATSLRKAGLCGDHFDEKCFTNATRKALRRNVVPRHYTEDLKYRKANNGNSENNEGVKENAASEEDDPMICERLSPFVDLAPNENHRIREIHDESSLQSGEYVADPIAVPVGNRSPSPVVEFIVEELDESLICGKSELQIETTIFADEENNEDNHLNENAYEESPMSMDDTEDTELTEENYHPTSAVAGLRVNRSNSDVRTYYRSKNHHPISSEDLIRIKTEENSEELEQCTDDERNTTELSTSAMFHDTSNSECRNRRHEKMLFDLREENKTLRKKMRLLKQNLRRSKAREANYLKVRDLLKDIDEFLNIQECNNPVARAMVKLALHKNRCPYTKEEKDFATQLYRHSSTAFIRMRRAGCNFPGRNTMKRWIAEDDGTPSTCNFMHVADDAIEDEEDDADDIDDYMPIVLDEVNETHENMENVDEGVEVAIDEIHESVDNIDNSVENEEVTIDGVHEIDNNMHSIIEDSEVAIEEVNETGDNMHSIIEDAEVAIDDLVEHLEEVIGETTEQEEYVQVYPPDDDD